jgi:hypothetical protein
MKFPIGSNCADHAKNITRAILAASSIVKSSPGVLAVVARPAVVAAPAYAARPASALVPASANTAGVVAGALFLDSPAYPPGTAIPAIPFKPATLAREAAMASPAVAAAAAIPGVKPWNDAFKISAFVGGTDLIVELPYSPKIYAQTLDLGLSIVEVPGTSMVVPTVKSFANPSPLATPKNLESYIYGEMLQAGAFISPRYDPLTGRDFINCILSASDELPALLIDPTLVTTPVV